MPGNTQLLLATKPLIQPTFLDAGAGAAEVPLAGTMQVPYPAVVAMRNFLLCHVYVIGSIGPSSISLPAGWAAISSVQSADTLAASRAFWKEATGAESGNLDVTITDGGVIVVGRMYRFSHGSGVEGSSSQMTDATGTAMDARDVTTLGIRRLAVQLLGANVNTTIGDITGESGADYAEAVAEYSHNGAGGSDAILSCQIATVAAAAAITGGSATLGATGAYRARHGFAIKP